jgi:DNA-binding MarR family transcriptional regulator
LLPNLDEWSLVENYASVAVVDFDIKHMVGHLIRVSQQVHFSLWLDGIGQDALTSPQFAVLHELAQAGAMGQRALGVQASLDRSTIADIIARLQRRGLIGRSQDPKDGRRKLVELTPLGREVHDRALPLAYEINEALLTPLGDGERHQLIELLTKIVNYHTQD